MPLLQKITPLRAQNFIHRAKSVNLPTDEWLCRKMSKLNITLVQGYPTRTSEAGGLLRDQFVRPPKSQQKWYGFHANPKKDSDQSVSSWHTGSRLNSTYLRIAGQAGIASSPPMSRLISQELFLVPKPDNKWRPILDLSNLNPFLGTEKFKMETPETIRTSLQQGEWVTSIDFKDASTFQYRNSPGNS